MELVKEEVFDALRSAAAHGARPQVAAEGSELAAEGDYLELEHQPVGGWVGEEEGRGRAG